MRDRKVYILGGLRSHIGIRYGIFKSVRPEVLGGRVSRRALQEGTASCRTFAFAGMQWDPEEISEDCFFWKAVSLKGCLLLRLISSALPVLPPSIWPAGRIAAGQCDVVLAGGAESASLQPKRIYADHDERAKLRNPEFTAAQFMPGEFGDDAMLLGAERAAKAAGITREEADEAALRSQMLAKDASENGIFRDVILPLFGSTRDEAIRPRMSRKLLERAPRVTDFQDGILTAANSCTMNDGAAFLLLVSEAWADEHEITPAFEIADTRLIGSDPKVPPLAADAAVSEMLEANQLTYEDIDAFEYNEAFAVISAHFMKKHPEVAGRLNQAGNALAYGHPYGASGAEIMIHLMEILREKEGRLGAAAIPAAGGVGEAILVKRTEAEE